MKKFKFREERPGYVREAEISTSKTLTFKNGSTEKIYELDEDDEFPEFPDFPDFPHIPKPDIPKIKSAPKPKLKPWKKSIQKVKALVTKRR